MVLVLVLMILACVLMVLALVLKVLTALALVLISFSLMDSEVIYNPKKITHLLTHSVNNIGLRDASASKKASMGRNMVTNSI